MPHAVLFPDQLGNQNTDGIGHGDARSTGAPYMHKNACNTHNSISSSTVNSMERTGTATAHTNIALIKYWGKKDEALRLPFTDSISLTLADFYTTTEVTVLDSALPKRFTMNGSPVQGKAADRVWQYIARLQQRFGVRGSLAITTENHVPTSAGLASSSSAFAALAGAFAAAYGLQVDMQELSRMARLGSGSASRSVYGGFARWIAGSDDATSVAVPIDEHPSFALRMIAVQIDVKPKAISSTAGMRRVVETSPYFPVWVEHNVDACERMQQAIADSDFTTLGELAQQNALDMHALNLTARPGFTYFEPQTLQVLQAVDQLRQEGVECYYTMDAGPNVKVLVQPEHEAAVLERLAVVVPDATMLSTGVGPGITMSANGVPVSIL
ncbi:diphosphomevalonate decarboxylase [Galliscardovia ingluviei]|uniref:diphosphomevalonate decarboxylase n=1 Tax=Galliscardovia ingluviei TaxID=1769422 RepID=A0A8J3EY03_9BIFI|nr:diphosphomevalonate decarboxylase [Galliscardovia ingluviei]GGI15530.1 diphosphomevalonate decarboxylase [Galliscardovia ingluviei]